MNAPGYENPSRPLYVFIHIQKAAGTSIRAAFGQLFAPSRIFWHGETGMVGDLVAADRGGWFDGIDLIGGHFGRDSIAPYVGARPVVTLSVLRNPVAQIISHFEYVKNRPENPLHTALPFAEAIVPPAPFAVVSRGLQSRMLTGRGGGDAAFRTLAGFDHVVVTIDRAQALVDRVAQLVGRQPPQLPHINVQPKGYRDKYSAMPDALESVKALAHQDFRLFAQLVDLGGVSERLRQVRPPRRVAAREAG